jgi:flagellar basal-body rod modification protein FlgD
MAVPLLSVLGSMVPTVVNAVAERIAPKADQGLGKDDFLRLLVAQIRHQNPLNPLSNDQFITQTATFTSLEELQRIRQSLEANAGAGAASGVAAATALIGRSVTATAGQFTYAGATATLPFTLDRAVESVAVEIADPSGTVLSRVPLGSRAPGQYSVDFTPGITGPLLPAGSYRYRIVSQDLAGRATPLPAIAGVVTGVSLEGGVPVLSVGGRRVALGDVIAVGPTSQ